ncbi:hypothetical protein [Photorhabdus luminescens]|uniref:hypothetical protein n=1 Tax=Photorhabdus luminescens TaxID=29488 RepID=UPI001130CAA2|nr:hypothetical protein [Photorhabdus luminescens]
MATGKLLPVGQPMNTKKTFINKLKQDIGWMVVHCRWWSMPIWVGMICLSVGIFSSPTLFAASTINWNADRAIDALGPARKVKRSDGIITYPATGKATLKDVFPTLSMKWGSSSKTLDQVTFQIKAGHGEIFKVPRVVSGRYECSIEAKFTNGRPGVAIPKENMTVDIDGTGTKYSKSPVALVARTTGNQDDESVAKAELSDLSFDVSCQGVDFSWERKADEKVEFETQNVDAPVGILIDGWDFMWWSKPTLPPIKDPVTVLDPPVCGLDAGDHEPNPNAVVGVAEIGEVLRSSGPYPVQLLTGGFTGFSGLFTLNITCKVSDKNSAGGVATMRFSAPQLADNNESIVVPGFDDALRIKVVPTLIGGNTKLAASNAMGRPVKFGFPTNPADVLYFTVGDTPNTYVSRNRFEATVWQVKALDPGTFGEFQTTMNATLVVR